MWDWNSILRGELRVSERAIERVQFWFGDEYLDFWILDAADASLQLESECGARRFVPFPSPLL